MQVRLEYIVHTIMEGHKVERVICAIGAKAKVSERLGSLILPSWCSPTWVRLSVACILRRSPDRTQDDFRGAEEQDGDAAWHSFPGLCFTWLRVARHRTLDLRMCTDPDM